MYPSKTEIQTLLASINCQENMETMEQFVEVLLDYKEHLYVKGFDLKYNLWACRNHQSVSSGAGHLLGTFFLVNRCVHFYYYPLLKGWNFGKELPPSLKAVLGAGLHSPYAFRFANIEGQLKSDLHKLISHAIESLLPDSKNFSKC